MLEHKGVPAEDLIQLRALLLEGKTKADGLKEHSEAYRKIVEDILKEDPLVLTDLEGGYRVLTFYVPSDSTDRLLNLVVLQVGGKYRQAQLYEYAISPGFDDSLRLGAATMADYRGKIEVFTTDMLITRLTKSGLANCFELAITNSNLNRPSTGGGGGSSGGSPSGPGGGRPSGGGGSGIPSHTGSGKPECTQTRTQISYDSGGNPHVYIIVERCGTRPIAVRSPEGTFESAAVDSVTTPFETKLNAKKEDCGALLLMLGIQGRYNRSRVSPGSKDEMLIETVLQPTKYTISAVTAILDIDKFKKCGATLDCVNQQVSTYLNREMYDSKATGLRASFTGLSADQLAAFLNAYYGSSGNLSVVAAIRFAAMRSDLSQSSKLSLHLLSLAILSSTC